MKDGPAHGLVIWTWVKTSSTTFWKDLKYHILEGMTIRLPVILFTSPRSWSVAISTWTRWIATGDSMCQPPWCIGFSPTFLIVFVSLPVLTGHLNVKAYIDNTHFSRSPQLANHCSTVLSYGAKSHLHISYHVLKLLPTHFTVSFKTQNMEQWHAKLFWILCLPNQDSSFAIVLSLTRG